VFLLHREAPNYVDIFKNLIIISTFNTKEIRFKRKVLQLSCIFSNNLFLVLLEINFIFEHAEGNFHFTKKCLFNIKIIDSIFSFVQK